MLAKRLWQVLTFNFSVRLSFFLFASCICCHLIALPPVFHYRLVNGNTSYCMGIFLFLWLKFFSIFLEIWLLSSNHMKRSRESTLLTRDSCLSIWGLDQKPLKAYEWAVFLLWLDTKHTALYSQQVNTQQRIKYWTIPCLFFFFPSWRQILVTYI